ncbi:MAG: hypothetical protein LBG06_10470 [Deltaproteobacteria bacterium]|jgi:hypothetical protein|nr:hypothetical protein [Deltaproteobacteria bacterium]
MNSIDAAKGALVPSQTRSPRETLREEILGEIFGRGRGRREKAEARPEPVRRQAPVSQGKGYYVDLYV